MHTNSGAFGRRHHELPTLFEMVNKEVRILLGSKAPSSTRPSRPKQTPAHSPHLPSFALLRACATAAASPHKICSACHTRLSDIIFRVISVTPCLSLCQACFETPTSDVGRLLLATVTVQQVTLPNAAATSSTEASSAEPVSEPLAPPFQILRKPRAIIAALCTSATGTTSVSTLAFNLTSGPMPRVTRSFDRISAGASGRRTCRAADPSPYLSA